MSKLVKSSFLANLFFWKIEKKYVITSTKLQFPNYMYLHRYIITTKIKALHSMTPSTMKTLYPQHRVVCVQNTYVTEMYIMSNYEFYLILLKTYNKKQCILLM